MGARVGGERTVQKVKERKVKRRRRRDMTGRYEALKGALVAPLTTLLGGGEVGGGGGGGVSCWKHRTVGPRGSPPAAPSV